MTNKPSIRRAAGVALAIAALAAGFGAATSADAGPVLDKIKQRGVIRVGVGSQPGFFSPDANGKWQGFFVDFGRALAVTVFNDPDKVEFTNSSPQQRLPALQAGQFDVLLSGVTETITRSFKLNFHFGPVVFYDGQGILVKKSLGVTKAVRSRRRVDRRAERHHGRTQHRRLLQEDRQDLQARGDRGHQHLLAGAAVRPRRRPDPGQLRPRPAPRRLPKSRRLRAAARAPVEGAARARRPLAATTVARRSSTGPSTRRSRPRNAASPARTSTASSRATIPAIKRFLGVDPSLGEAIGLDPKFAYNIIKKVGNYGEIFERNLGKWTKIGFDRGLNRLWTQGGLLYSPPFR